MKKMFLLVSLLGVFSVGAIAQDDQELDQLLDFDSADEDLSYDFHLSRPFRPGRPERPHRPHRPERPERREGWSFYGCYEHRRYCERDARSSGYDKVNAELDSTCPNREPWACYVWR